MNREPYLPEGLPRPNVMEKGLDRPYWEGLNDNVLRIQHCNVCGTWIWGPEHLCYKCLTWDPEWREAAARGQVYSWTRVWSPFFPQLKSAVPFIAVLVELPEAGNVRMIGNLLGDPMQPVKAGDPVVGRFERHENGGDPYTLLQWEAQR